jgi:hypothetical protein
MIEFTQEQLNALDASEQPAVALDPRTGQEYLLIRREVYEKVRSVLKPFGRAWEDPADDDLIGSVQCFSHILPWQPRE